MATPISRREFLAASASSVIASASAVHANSWAATPGEPSQEKVLDPVGIFWILTVPNPSFHEQLAAKELERGIRKLRFSQQQRRGFLPGPVTDKKDLRFEISTEPGRFKHSEDFEVALHECWSESTQHTGEIDRALRRSRRSMQSMISSNGRELSLALMEKSTLWNPGSV